MIINKKLVETNKHTAAQWGAIKRQRLNAAKIDEGFYHAGLVDNAGSVPQDSYVEFDSISVERFRADEGDAFLVDLLAVSRPISLGKLISKHRQASDAGQAVTSMTGQVGVNRDQVEHTYGSTLIPIHQTGWELDWRSVEAQRSEAFDANIDNARESTSTLRIKVVDSFLDGHNDRNGDAIVLDGVSWSGMRNDARVNQIDMGVGQINFDFSDTSQTGADIKLNFLEIRDVMFITNNIAQDLTYYVSREIASNFERAWSVQYNSRTIMEELAGLMGVASIKVSSKLVDNEIMGMVLGGSNGVRPLVGMGINTVALPRLQYNSNYMFDVWGAIGFEVRNDFAGKSGAFFAQ